MSDINDALDELYEAIHDPDNGGETVTYRRGDDEITLYATIERAARNPFTLVGYAPGDLDFAQANPVNTDHDFGILAADLVIDDEAILPERGDEILRTVDGVTSVYRVMAPQSGGRMWEWMDGYDKRLVVHTKFTETE